MFHLLVPGVTDAYAEVALIGELLEFQFPGPCPVAVAASGVGGDEQGRRVRVGSPTHPLPPLANRRDGEGGRIVVAPHAHPRLVSGHIVDAVRDGLPTGIRREIVDEHRFRLARWLPFPPSVLELRRRSGHRQVGTGVQAVAQLPEEAAVIAGGFKLILSSDEQRTMLYDLTLDPSELEDRARDWPDLELELRQTMDQFEGSYQRTPPTSELTDEQTRRLRSLGYVR